MSPPDVFQNKSIEAMIEMGIDYAQTQFRADGEIMPAWLCVNDANEMHIIATPWSSEDEKEFASRVLRRFFKEKNIDRYCSVLEAWSSAAETQEDVDRIRREGASQQANRVEVVIITAVKRGEPDQTITLLIKRPEGKPAYLERQTKEVPPLNVTGRMVNMLGEGPKRH